MANVQRATSGHGLKWDNQTGLWNKTSCPRWKEKQLPAVVICSRELSDTWRFANRILWTTLPWLQGICLLLVLKWVNALLLEHICSVIKDAGKTEGWKEIEVFYIALGYGVCHPNVCEICCLWRMSVKDNRLRFWTKYEGNPSERGKKDKMGGNSFHKVCLHAYISCWKPSNVSYITCFLCTERICIQYRCPTSPIKSISYLLL